MTAIFTGSLDFDETGGACWVNAVLAGSIVLQPAANNGSANHASIKARCLMRAYPSRLRAACLMIVDRTMEIRGGPWELRIDWLAPVPT